MIGHRGTAGAGEDAKGSAAETANVAGSKAKEGKDAAADTVYSAANAAGSKAKAGKETAADAASGESFDTLCFCN